MKRYYTYLILLGVLCLNQRTLLAQTGQFYSTNDGLSSTLINQIYQDEQGFIWIATEYGLNKFDGLHFTDYKQLAGNTTALKSNYVRTLGEDSHHNLLVGCIDGLMRYDAAYNTFREIPMLRGGKRVYPHVVQMQRLHNGELWMVTSGQGIFRLDEERQEALSLDSLMEQIETNFLSCIYEDNYHAVWIGTEDNGLVRYPLDTRQVQLFQTPMLTDNFVTAINADRYGNLLIGTRKGVARYDRTRGAFVSLKYADGKDSNLSVYCMASVGEQLVIGTDGQGLKSYNRTTDRIDNYLINTAPIDYAVGKIHAVMEDRDKNIWLGLFQKGIALIPHQKAPFEYYGERSQHYNPIGQGCVMSIYQDSKRNLWVGSDNEGLFQLDTQGRRVHHYQPLNTSTSVANTILCMYEDSEGNFWLGSYTRGPARMNRSNGVCDYPLALASEKIFSITEDRRKNLYIATLGAGIYRYNLITRELKHYESSRDETGDLHRNELPNDYVNYIYCDSEGMIWLAHYRGISCFDPVSESFINYHDLNTLFEGSIGYVVQEDYAGTIWAGTTNGLYSFDKQTGEIHNYTVADGLPDPIICGICEDRQHNLWISTYKGISCFDRTHNRFVNYYTADGLQDNEFTHGAFFKNRTGKMYFGGTGGITAFLPDAITETPNKMQVLITEFYLFDRSVHKESRSGSHTVTHTAVSETNLFELSHNDNTFSVVFSTLQYGNAQQIAYQYRIDELSNRWSVTEPGVNRVTYNNLPPGRYTLHIRAVTHGNYSDTRTIRIFIAPPWYQTWWAYTLYLALIALMLTSTINYLLTRMRHRREITKREHAEQLNEAKLQFFINISHEIRTPMTLIISPLEKLLAEKPGGELQKTYLMIYRNAQRILRLINQLMDIRKVDKGQMNLKFRETDLVGFIDDVMLTFDVMARKKHIRFTFLHDDPQLNVWIDLNNFDKVLMNIFSNAFKYTPEEGEIVVRLTTGHDPYRHDPLRNYFEITITDSGIGIDEDKIERIFERFYQIDNGVTESNFGTGIGLHLSRSLVELHHGTIRAENRTDGVSGTSIIIRIPLKGEQLHANEPERTDEAEPVMRSSQMDSRVNNLLHEEETPAKTPHPTTHKRSLRDTSVPLILIAEDDEEIRTYVKEELESDYRIMICVNGKEAYDKILTKKPDLLISDIMMPELDGLSLCRKVKRNLNVNHIPVVLLTAKSKPEETVEGMETGADAYIVKPFNMELLKGTIANLIANRQILKNKFSGVQQQKDRIEKIEVRSADDQLMERLMKAINENLANPDLSADMLAEQVGLSRVHLHRKIKELTGQSLRNYIRYIRLQQAAILLREKKHSISEVAYATGFTNLSHFSSCFREQHGIGPKEYMQNKGGE
ncbi:MAG: response regulator [Prevotellaceae bacterium]|jgi:signal transduction histidine kinase/ligand-binding sensor domain-containing protein/DNA-binding response OmpR family regulator|nr:response regulator [Prevotellaceae bacterium]